MEDNTRTVSIASDAEGNVVITGDQSRVFIIHATRAVEPEAKPAQALGSNPYKGLGAFQERDANFFFGREELTELLWTKFRDLHEPQPGKQNQYRILPILGPSGSGKSSVARAGLLPELARRPFSDKNSVRVAVLVPGAHPLESLATILARVLIKEEMPVAKIREFTDQLRLPSANNAYDGLRRIAATIPDISTAPLIILIHQFEEVYSLCDDIDERKIFVNSILTAAKDRSSHVSIILTLRTDFIGQTNKPEELSRIIATHGVLVPAMSRDELERAITQPAALSGHPLDSATVELLISETKEGALPLLQFALTRIWEGMEKGVSPAETLRKLGGVGGALAREAERLYESLGEDADKALARRAFLSLVRVGNDIPTTRRTLPIDDLVPEGEESDHVREVLERFASPGARILTLSANAARQETAKIAHEALIEHWQQFGEWIKQAYDDLLFQYRLEDAARYWELNKRDKGLLWRSPDLDRLKKFRNNPERKLTKLQSEFADASEWEARKSLIYKIAGVTAALILFISSLYSINAFRQASNRATNENINGFPESSPTNEESDPLGEEIKPEAMTPGQKAALEKIEEDVAYLVQTLNQLFKMNLGVPNISLKNSLPNIFWDTGKNTYVAPTYVENLPEATYHAVSYYFILKVSHVEYKGEGAAIIQSDADIYAELTNQRRLNQTAADADWEIAPGYQAALAGVTSRTMTDTERKAPKASLKDPKATSQIAHIRDLVVAAKGSLNQSHIYINKGISNNAFYETAIKIGTDKAAAIWTNALPKLSNKVTFQELANALASQAANLYGKDSAEHTAVRNAWQVVGVTAR